MSSLLIEISIIEPVRNLECTNGTHSSSNVGELPCCAHVTQIKSVINMKTAFATTKILKHSLNLIDDISVDSKCAD